jgi:uncharacterized membrane protein
MSDTPDVAEAVRRFDAALKKMDEAIAALAEVLKRCPICQDTGYRELGGERITCRCQEHGEDEARAAKGE